MDQTIVVSQLDSTKNHDPRGNEYWRARELQEVLGYSTWRNFATVIEKAQQSCKALKVDATNQFVETSKMVAVGSGGVVPVEDFFLSRYAAYLVAMNGDPTKPEVAYAQAYFAVQTIRQEQADQLSEDEKRIQLRARVKDANKNLNSAAKDAGVINYAYFHDKGYLGLYGMRRADIAKKKNLPANEDLLDCAGRTELAANEFRITQTQDRLRAERVKGQAAAERTHFEVGKKVRKAIEDIGGTMPENLPPETPIKKLKTKSMTKYIATTRKKKLTT
ncbi:MAG: DNA damage-inducible protein D [Acidobacteriota bacterium]